MIQSKKPIIILCLLFLLLGNAAAFAEDGLLDDADTKDSTGQKWLSIRVSPLVLLIAAVNVEADIRIMDNLTIGPMVTYWGFDLEGDSYKFTGYGARANWYFTKTMQGPYLSPFIKRYGLTLTSSNGEEGSLSLNAFGGIIGYEWLWDSINMNLEAGFSLVGNNVEITVKDSAGNVLRTEAAPTGTSGGLVLDWTIGFAF